MKGVKGAVEQRVVCGTWLLYSHHHVASPSRDSIAQLSLGNSKSSVLRAHLIWPLQLPYNYCIIITNLLTKQTLY